MARKAVAKVVQEVESTAAYLRVSTDDQRKSGLGIEAQRSKCIAMCHLKDWPEPVFYVDDGISGTKEVKKRPALARLLDDLQAGKHQAVIILSLDRLARKTRLILDLVEEIGQLGILVSCKESLDTATPQGQFFLTICAAMAQYERDLISQRTAAALAELDKKTGEHGGRIPYGYVRTPEGLKTDRQQAQVVRRIFSMRQQGETLRAIAERLNKLHIPASRSGQWYHTSVKEVLTHKTTYQGGQRGASIYKWPVILKEA